MTYRFDIITLFPELVEPYIAGSILGRALKSDRIEVAYTNPRDFADDRHRTVDDAPFGGGAGMVMKPEPLARAIEAVRDTRHPERVVLLSPGGRLLTQDVVREYAGLTSLCLVCGRYEGVDERIAEHLIDEELSVGDYVLTGGELGALAVVDAVSRTLPGVLGNAVGADEESFTGVPLLEHAQYTRPREWRGHEVPAILLSGDHAAIARHRQEEREQRTRERRPDLWARYEAGERSQSASNAKTT